MDDNGIPSEDRKEFINEKSGYLLNPSMDVIRILAAIEPIMSDIPLTAKDINAVLGTQYSAAEIEDAARYSFDIRIVTLRRRIADSVAAGVEANAGASASGAGNEGGAGVSASGHNGTEGVKAFFIGDQTAQQLQPYNDPGYVLDVEKYRNRFAQTGKKSYTGLFKKSSAASGSSDTAFGKSSHTASGESSHASSGIPDGNNGSPDGSSKSEANSGAPSEKKGSAGKWIVIALAAVLVVVLIMIVIKPKGKNGGNGSGALTASSGANGADGSDANGSGIGNNSDESGSNGSGTGNGSTNANSGKESDNGSGSGNDVYGAPSQSADLVISADENGKFCLDKKMVGDMLAGCGITADYIFISQDWMDHTYDNEEAYIGCSDICTRLMAGINDPSMGDPYPLDKKYYTDPDNKVSIIVSAGRGEDGVKTGIVASFVGPAKEESDGSLRFTFKIKDIDRDEVWGQYTYDYRQIYMETVKDNPANPNTLSILEILAVDNHFIYAYFPVESGFSMCLHTEDGSFSVNRSLPSGAPDRMCLGFAIPVEVVEKLQSDSIPALYLDHIDPKGNIVATFALLMDDDLYHNNGGKKKGE